MEVKSLHLAIRTSSGGSCDGSPCCSARAGSTRQTHGTPSTPDTASHTAAALTKDARLSAEGTCAQGSACQRKQEVLPLTNRCVQKLQSAASMLHLTAATRFKQIVLIGSM